MYAKVTKSFRFTQKGETLKYTPGNVAEGEAARWSVLHKHGSKITAEEAGIVPATKTKSKSRKKSPSKKAHKGAPENK